MRTNADAGSGRDSTRRVFVVRHGSTSLNASGVLRGHLDPPLDGTGRREAMATAHALAGRRLSRVVSSPLKRAVETAATIATAAGLEVELDERLIDRDYRSWSGKPLEELLEHWVSLDAAADIEPITDVRARTLDAFKDITRDFEGRSAVALVTHDAIIRVLLPSVTPALFRAGPPRQDTGRYSVVERRGEAWRVVDINVDPGQADEIRSADPHPPPSGGD